ncbi:MAG: GDSL-type esterase/lipase family protein [Tannerellaceae bacterium]|jgi:lysophospholipase L1-like esterase|nr:GDSL-type esterase/lipase family protein [Tannerellaceae bacterium]
MMECKTYVFRLGLPASLVALLISIRLLASGSAQDVQPAPGKARELNDTLRSKLTFVVDSLCIVSDPEASLNPFFNALDLLNAGADTVISILHLGDSHIQAGHYSGRTMRLMHQSFGNAGRGWIAPFKITRSNEPDDYFITTLIREWTAGRAIQHPPRSPIGPGGIGIKTPATFVNFDISITPINGAGYGFNQVIVYRGDKSMPMLPSGKSRDVAQVYDDSRNLPAAFKMLADTIRFGILSDTLSLQSTRRQQGTDLLLPASSFDNLYYGFSLSNGQPGVLYHSVGVNGSMFVSYTDERYVAMLAETFHPSLLIISLGTNESFGRRFTANEFRGQVEDFLSLIRKRLPQTAILLTTPPECYKRVVVNKQRRYVRNENTERVARTLMQIAADEGIACWDLFSATGGRASSTNWFNGKWMGRDRIHFNKEGYEEQGLLLFKALINLKTERRNGRPD